MTEPAVPAFGVSLDAELRSAIAEVSGGIVVDNGGGTSLLKVLVLAELIVADNLSTIVEIGVYRGRLMLPLARLMSRLGRGEVIGIDPYSPVAAVQRQAKVEGMDLVEWPSTIDWDGLHRELLEGISRWQLEASARLIRERSQDAVSHIAGTRIDVLHVDGNHDRDAVTADVELFLPHMADGGILVMDDISWPTIRPVYERLLDEHELLFSLSDRGVNLLPGDVPNDFAVLRVRGNGAAGEARAGDAQPARRGWLRRRPSR